MEYSQPELAIFPAYVVLDVDVSGFPAMTAEQRRQLGSALVSAADRIDAANAA